MNPLDAGLVLAAGCAAGLINAVVGSGTLITFPALLAMGYPPVVANASNAVGLSWGGAASLPGFRRELAGQGRLLLRLGLASATGGLVGGILLLTLSAQVFDAVVPGLILLGCALVALQPWLARRVRAVGAGMGGDRPTWRGPAAPAVTFLTGIYGGYFGAAQGVLLMGALGLLLRQDPYRLNAIKNAMAMAANLASGLLFMVVADIAWPVAVLIGVGSMAGGLLGARVGRRIPPTALRVLILVVGVVSVVRFLAG